MKWILTTYGVQLLIVVIIILGSWLVWDRRFKSKHGQEVPHGFVRTKEVFLDPGTNKRFIVYFNSDTGERFYKEES